MRGARLRQVDEGLYRRLTRGGSPRLDALFGGASRAADNSLLWLGAGALLVGFGGRRGRGAALRGLAALGIASAIANGPMKLISRRPRPAGGRPGGRFRQPRTSSFPSAHTSSGFAFATAVGAELPSLRVPLGLLAATVGYSRIHNRVHYPSDVLVGAVLGVVIGAGIATTLGRRCSWRTARATRA